MQAGSLASSNAAGVSQTVLFVAAFAAIGGFLYGYDLGLISGALLSIAEDFSASDTAQAWIVGAAKAGACLGTFLGGAAMYKYGRIRTIGGSGAFFVAGPALMASADSIAQLVVGRLVLGFGIGVSAVVIPAYLAELAPARLRGALVITYEGLLCIGMLISIITDAALEDTRGNWRWMTGSPIAPALLYALAPWLLPESPRWLVMRGNLDGALAVLLRVNSKPGQDKDAGTAAAEQELLMLWSAIEQSRSDGTANGAALTAGGSELSDLGANPFAAAVSDQQRAPGASTGKGSPAYAQGSDSVQTNGRVEAGRVLQAATNEGVEHEASSEATAAREGQPLEAFGYQQSSDSVPSHADLQRQHSRRMTASRVWQSIVRPAAQPQPQASKQAALQGQGRYDTQKSLLATLVMLFSDTWYLFRGHERRAALVAVWLAVFNQIGASTSIINYAPRVLEDSGIQHDEQAILLSSLIALAKTAGVVVGAQRL